MLKGSWKGTILQYMDGKAHMTYDAHISIDKIGRKTISGIGTVIYQGEKLTLVLKGSFRNDRFLKVDYQNKNTGYVQFGCFVFHLGDDSKSLDGKLVGYGHVNRAIIHGDCNFIKE